MANRRFIDFPVATTVGANDIILIWQDGLNKQTTKATILSGLPEDLEDLADVNISGLTNGQILRYDSTTGKWENTDQGNLDLNDLNDVSIVSPSNGQVLVYNSSTSKWENSSAGFVPYTGAVTTVNLGAQSILAGTFVKAGGTSAQFLKADGSVDSSTYLTTGSAAATYVPYTGATADVDLGTHDLTAERGTFENNGSSDTITVNHTSGSGIGVKVTKGGNNEALLVTKTSGSGNAMAVVGGRTSLVDLSLSSVSNATGNFLTISGGVVHQRTAAQTLTDIGGQAALTNPVTGTGTTNYLPKFTGGTTIGNSQIFDNGTNVGVGTTTASAKLQVQDADNIFVVHFSGLNQTNGISFGTSSSNFALIQGYTRTFGGTNDITMQLSDNLLIGTTTSTGEKFQVNGTSKFSGTITGNSTIIAGFQGGNIQLKGATDGFVGVNASNTLFLTDWATGTKGLQINLSTGAATFNSSVQATQFSSVGGRGTSFGFTLPDWQIYNTTGNALAFSNYTTDFLTIASTGAATFSSSVSTPHTTKTADYTLDATDYTVGFDCASNRTATLPDATTCQGRIYVIYQYNTGTAGERYVTLDGNGSQTINGLTTFSLQYHYDFSSVMIQSNGSNWIIISDALYPAPV
jgi:hypothetical protein